MMTIPHNRLARPIRPAAVLLACSLALIGCERGGEDGDARDDAAAQDRPRAAVTASANDDGTWQITLQEADGPSMAVDIAYDEDQAAWRTIGRYGLPRGLLLGPPDLPVASLEDLRAMNRAPREAVRAFDPQAVRDSPLAFEQIMLFQGYKSDLIIGRVEDDRITDLWYIGPFLPHMVEQHAQGRGICEALLDRCTRVGMPMPDGHERAADDALAWPIVSACLLYVHRCDDSGGYETLCRFLYRACVETDMNLPEELLAVNASACVAGIEICGANQTDPPDEPLARAGDEVRRLAELLDAMVIRLWNE